MTQPRATFNKDFEDILNKYDRLLREAREILQEITNDGGGIGPENILRWFAMRTSALNLIERTAGESSIYYRALLNAQPPDQITGTMPALSVSRNTSSRVDGFSRGIHV